MPDLLRLEKRVKGTETSNISSFGIIMYPLPSPKQHDNDQAAIMADQPNSQRRSDLMGMFLDSKVPF